MQEVAPVANGIRMSLVNVAIRQLQDAPFPDFIARPAIDSLVSEARRRLDRDGPHDQAAFAREMARRAVAEHTTAANDQHYELPPEFFEICLGARLKYSCCLYGDWAETLDQAEEKALAETCAHAELADGQTILELGCGWGSLSLWMAERYPAARITAVSNSHGQRGHIEAQARARGLTNLTVVTCDMNDFQAESGGFDRIVSVEMFEHMANWRALLTRARGWLKPDGRMFIHVFTHRDAPYRFDHTDSGDFIAQHFFTGGIMPSAHTLLHFQQDLTLEERWFLDGTHYARTANHWLANQDARAEPARAALAQAYGAPLAGLWHQRWRMFWMACAELFGYDDGQQWGVAHYRFTRP